MTQGEDRRVKRTRSALRSAFLELIAVKGYDETSIRDVVDRADVGRATFYKHYADKEDLLRQSLADLAEHLRASMREERGAERRVQGGAERRIECGDALAFSLPTLEHIAQVQPMFTALLASRGSQLVQELFLEVLEELVDGSLESVPTGAVVPRAALVKYLSSTLLAMARWWILEAPERQPREVHAIYVRLVGSGLGGL